MAGLTVGCWTWAGPGLSGKHSRRHKRFVGFSAVTVFVGTTLGFSKKLITISVVGQ